MPKTRIEFGFNDEYSSEHWLEFVEMPLLPDGFQLRYDIPLKDEEGRWARNNNGSFDVDAGDPIYAKVVSSQGQVNSDDQESFDCVCVMVEVEGGKEEIDKVNSLLKFMTFLKCLKHAKKFTIIDSDSGFTSEQSHFLQQRMCETVADVAKLFIGSFHKSDKKMVSSIEQVLNEKWGLMFACGPSWYSYHGPASESPKKVKKK